MITLTVNNVRHDIDVDPSTPLLYVLRNQLQLNGAKYGCGLGQCGACTVIVGDEPVFSCLLPVAACGGRAVRTIEGLGTIEHPGPLQRAFIDQQAAQCGYCIAGMVMRAQVLLERTSAPTDEQIRAHMQPNLCRCGTHMRIVAAIRQAASDMSGQHASPETQS
ncbi:(2Fe-2S)-binding protein [Paraburkholderia edwinii]|jgi:nicotinate dehydrogenase subunit A|uniref:(2Fe-2S)-binding protein n=1 Tax=Paraburkholderia edwinii TaxID=2861782 RepID=A0ABX8ULS6_9BURK|nr:(2Fe-2S)-binding protein [Paraburkholderia edwinii]QYD69814.1 (2Fe-2S)-binding protein [Paraburkholderia edwinii]